MSCYVEKWYRMHHASGIAVKFREIFRFAQNLREIHSFYTNFRENETFYVKIKSEISFQP
jgi:hypothetical protein